MKKKLLYILLLPIILFVIWKSNVHEVGNKYLKRSVYNVLAYGAKGDSVTDDRAAIIRCFNDAKKDSNSIVFFPDGRYLISDSIVVPTGLTIMGTSSGHNSLPINAVPVPKYPTGSTIIVTSSTHKGFVINSPGGLTTPGSIVKPVTIEKLSFWNTGGTTPTSPSAGIIVRDLMQFTLRDMQIQGFYINLNVISGDYWTTDNCRFADAVQYQMAVGDDILPDAGDMFISNCVFETLFTRQPRAGIYYHSGGGMKITNCKFNKWDSDDANRSIYGIIVEMDGATSDFLVNNCSIENFDSTGIYIHQVGNTTFYNALINNVQIATSVAKGSPIKIVGGGSGDFGVVSLGNYTVTDYGTSNNSNPWLTLTNTNYVNVGIGTVRYYASAAISGGTNLGTIYDATISQWIIPYSQNNSKVRVGSIELTGFQLNNSQLADNTYYNSVNQVYRANGFASYIGLTNGNIYFQTAPSGSAGATATFNSSVLLNNGSWVYGFATDQTGSKLQFSGSESHGYRAITALRTLDATDHIINCTANSFTVTLPTAVGITGREYIIKNTGSATTITIATTSSQTIDGAAPGTITTLVPLRVVSNGANWITFNMNIWMALMMVGGVVRPMFKRKAFHESVFNKAA